MMEATNVGPLAILVSCGINYIVVADALPCIDRDITRRYI